MFNDYFTANAQVTLNNASDYRTNALYDIGPLTYNSPIVRYSNRKFTAFMCGGAEFASNGFWQ